jgi:PAS domain-containing protein
MSEDVPSERRDDARELQDLREFFYQCPVGLFEVDDDGLVLKVNPAAVAMLAPAIGSDNLAKLFPLLDRLAPQMVRAISQDRDRMGPLADVQRILIPAETHGTSSLEVGAVRVAPGRVMVVLLDVSAERLMRRPPPPATRRSLSRGKKPRRGSGCRLCRRSRPGSPRQ